MFARFLFVALVSVMASLFAACGDGPEAKTTPTPTAEDTGPITGLPVLGPAIQELQFVGVVEGALTDSDASCAWFRDPAGGPGKFQMAIQGLIEGKRHVLRVIVNGYTGPGDYSWDGVAGSGPEVNVELDNRERGHATIFIDAQGTGEISATITSPSQGRITGLFECPGVPR